MKTTRQFLQVSALSLLVGLGAHAQTTLRPQRVVGRAPGVETTGNGKEITCTGTVTDDAGKPVSGATVEYWRLEEPGNRVDLKRHVNTTRDGAFELHVSGALGLLLARKSGLAPAWKQLGWPFRPAGSEMDVRLKLSAPTALAGVVVDESNKPVAGANVFVAIAVNETSSAGLGTTFNYLAGQMARDCFETRADAAGHFRIENFPAGATASLSVSSPGMALRQPEGFGGLNALPWRAGRQDIKLVVEPAGNIEGKIVASGAGPSLPVARVTLQPGTVTMLGLVPFEPVSSQTDGTFQIRDVPAGSYSLHAVFGTNALPDWVADSVPVSVASGRTTRVEMTAVRGGFLQATVLGTDDQKPLARVNVIAFKLDSQFSATSDSNGVALLRLPPGDYQVVAAGGSARSDQTQASVVAGETNQIEIDATPPRTVTGVVDDPEGRPAAGLEVWLIGNYGPATPVGRTDANGQFQLEWTPRQLGQNEATPAVLIRDAKRDLAVAQDLDEDTHALQLKLAPALTLAGRAEFHGKPVTNAVATLIFWTGRSGMWLPGLSRETNTPGRFEIRALPPGRKYGVVVSAPGYGQQSISDVGASAEAGRQELEPVELKLANLKLAGQVLDSDAKPVAGAFVNLQGDGQPSASARTGSDGRFQFDRVCEGAVRVFANITTAFGSVSAQGGDTNVVLTLGQTAGFGAGARPHKLTGLVTGPDGQPVAGAQVRVFPSNPNNSGWIRSQADGRFNLTWSLQPWQSQSGGALLVARDPARGLAVSADLTEDATNLDLRLKTALELTGQVKSAEGAHLEEARVGVWLKAGNGYEQLDPQLTAADPQGRFEINGLPPDARYIVFATANGHGRSQQQVQNDSGTNRLALAPFVLKLANHVVAGRVLNEDDKPVSGVNVSLNGEDQPDGYMTTDSKGRFHFQVCPGVVRLFANSLNGFAQASAAAGDTNIVMTLRSQSGGFPPRPRRASLQGKPLPDLRGVGLAGDAAPAGQAVLLCLFNASERPSRHAVHVLDEQAAALRAKSVCVLGVQSAVIGDDVFNAWKSAYPVSFPLGRVTQKSDAAKWASNVAALPWLILADRNHRVIAEGFSLDDLDAQLGKLPH